MVDGRPGVSPSRATSAARMPLARTGSGRLTPSSSAAAAASRAAARAADGASRPMVEGEVRVLVATVHQEGVDPVLPGGDTGATAPATEKECIVSRSMDPLAAAAGPSAMATAVRLKTRPGPAFKSSYDEGVLVSHESSGDPVHGSPTFSSQIWPHILQLLSLPAPTRRDRSSATAPMTACSLYAARWP